jgi:hypothetical protein
MSQQPKKPGAQKSKRHKLSISTADKWKQILKEVEKLEAPISVIQTITVSLVDGTQVDIDVQELIAEGMDINNLEREINQKLYDLDELIDNVDFFINIDHIANTVQPITDTLLKNL